VHEDDIAQVQFLPSQCRDFCLDQLDRIARYGAAHSDPDGVGWTKMYRIPPAPASVADLGIRVGDLAVAMPWRMRRIRRVLTGGWSEKCEPLPRTTAYMAGRAAIVFRWREDGILDFLWYHYASTSWWHRYVMRQALFRLGVLAPLLLVDWRGAIIDLRDRRSLWAYLSGSEDAGDDPSDEAPMPDPSGPPPVPANGLRRFDTPVFPVLESRRFAAGPVDVVLSSSTGQNWRLTIDDAAVHGGPIDPPRPIDGGTDAEIGAWCDIAGARVLAFRADGRREWLELWDARDGSRIVERPYVDAAVLCPDGDHLLLFEVNGIAVHDLRQPDAPPQQSGLFPLASEETDDKTERADVVLDNPGSVAAVASAPGEATFTLAIGDYGFAVVAELRLGRPGEPPLILTGRARTLSEGLVYDPVDIIDVFPGDRLVVRHGSGGGVASFDLRTGSVAECPLPDGNRERRYGQFGRVVAARPAPGLWLDTDLGPQFWSGSGDIRSLPRKASRVLATDGDNYLGISPDGWDLVRSRFSDNSAE